MPPPSTRSSAFRAQGGTVILVTNAPAPASQVQRRLDALAVPRDAYDAIATSGDVTIAMIVDAGCPPLFSIGPKGEYALFKEAARLGPRRAEIVPIAAADLVICIGLDDTGDRPEDYDGNLRLIRERDLDLICANPDIVVEVGDTLVYCAGAIAARYEALGGRVIHAGKPFAPIYDLAFALSERVRGATPKDRVLAIGDATHTDMRGAMNQGIASLLITSGIHREALHAAGRGSVLDEAALRRLLSQAGLAPTAALGVLAWTVPG